MRASLQRLALLVKNSGCHRKPRLMRGGTDTQCNMLFFFKINSEHELEWKVDQDLTTWVVVVRVVVHQQGFSTHLASNNRRPSSITERHFKIRVVAQFDVVLETNVFRFSRDMPVIGGRCLESVCHLQ